ncbi:MAG: orotidine-5'-phosphate decarboxylase [Betaproteobacteria bacterium HGW-Betaproteobacteria-1]|jgi:orotidine-5'-phosphate decarboxylase|nr:MAG: orotidine-5'-phosphate decarboxylase [Betaproteobacteria bacterium HGW-Betaproteobacteria-1]
MSQQSNNQEPRIVVALDYADAASALQLVERLDPSLCRLKVGKELFTAAGPQLVEKLIAKDFGVFLDLKFHDIPTTVQKACEAASRLGVWMLNVHASGGTAMMQAAREGVAKSGRQPLLIAVTVLTSMNQTALNEIGVEGELQNQVLRLAGLTKQAGLDGVVCSAQEAQLLKKQLGEDFCLVTPGIRPKTASLDDQSRVVTPSQAVAWGADYLVIGRPITQAADPLQALQAIHQELQNL